MDQRAAAASGALHVSQSNAARSPGLRLGARALVFLRIEDGPSGLTDGKDTAGGQRDLADQRVSRRVSGSPEVLALEDGLRVLDEVHALGHEGSVVPARHRA